MSDETKNNTTPESAQPAVTGADATPKSGGKAKQKPAEAKPKAKAKPEGDTGESALKAVGLKACKRHMLAQVWVTSDGQAFAQEGDAKEHARNLGDKVILKVTPK